MIGAVSLRSVLFHSVDDEVSPFTDGLGVTTPLAVFRERITYLNRRYHPVGLDAVRAAIGGEALPPRALLMTIDDAYATVADPMAAILDEAGIPAVFFVNGGFIDHRQLGTDNLVAYVYNTVGGRALAEAASALGPADLEPTLDHVLGRFVPTLDQSTLTVYRDRLLDALDHDPREVAAEEGLYLDRDRLASLPESMAVGSHTSTHVRCRTLAGDDFERELVDNRTYLELVTGRTVTAFSVPYGSRGDLTPAVTAAAQGAGHDLIFLVEGRLNHGSLAGNRLMRVSMKSASDLGSRLELEVWPRIRRLRDRLLDRR